MKSTFILNYQEKVSGTDTNLCKTKNILEATFTKTLAREEPDQDSSSLSLSIITKTSTRESPDNGISELSLGTQTVTKTCGEQADQDVNYTTYSVLPN